MKLYKMLAKEFLAEYTDTLQELRNLTHEEMAERLRITSRAYGDLEREQYRFSAIARLFLLLMLNADELKAFLKGFRKRSPPKNTPDISELFTLLYQLGLTANYTGFFHTSYAVYLATQQPDRLLWWQNGCIQK